MKHWRLLLSIPILSSVIFAALSLGRAFEPNFQASREDAYRANNIGVALLEQYKYKEAADSFRRALAIDAKLAIARINLAIALYNVPDMQSAAVEAKAAVEALPDSPHANYMLGLVARSQNQTAEAIAAFQQVLKIDPADVGANINLAQLYSQQRNYTEAIKLLRVAIASEPYSVTATYALGLALQRAGQIEESRQVIQRFQKLRESSYGTTLGQNYLEEGQYAEAVTSTGAEADLVDSTTPDVTFIEATPVVAAASAQAVRSTRFKASDLTDTAKRDLAALMSGDVTLFDYDGDGDLDMLAVAASSQQLFKNDGGKFSDVTRSSGLPAAGGIRAVAGDYDNDGKTDLFVLRYGASALYHNDGGGKFSDATAAAQIPAYPFLALSTAFVDIDHDGDLDIFIAGFVDLAKTNSADAVFPDDFTAAPNLLLRNNGNGKFTDITSEAKVAESRRGIAIVPTDYNNRRDVDLLIVNYSEPPTLFSNLRDGTFRNVAAEVGLDAKARFTCAAAGDFNKDGFTDFYFGLAGELGLMAASDGKGRFKSTAAGSESSTAAQFLDYDNDGLLDLALFSNGLRVFRNLGNRWADVSERTSRSVGLSPRAFASADIDSDGDTDIIAHLASGETKVILNEGGNRNQSVRVRLAGKVANRSGIGSKIEVRAGSLSQKFEYCSASPAPAPSDIVLGLGKRPSADAIRVLWPSGNVQSELETRSQTMTITEVDRKPSSCPYLYTWNGERMEFITDFMGGGEMGAWIAPGQRNHPDPDEYVRIREDQLRPLRGRYEIRITNELEEVLFVDRAQLVAVTHPSDTEVFPNEGLVAPPFPPFKLYVTKDARPPLTARDDHGCDMLDRISKIDRRYPDDFQLHRIRGYAEEHTLTMDIGKGEGKTLLLMTAWTDYAFSSDNVAASQSGLKMMPPALEVKDAEGRWKRVIADIGIPVGRPQTLVIDLSGRFLSASREVRIVTNMRIYWDQILVSRSSEGAKAQMMRLDPMIADLRWRGYSAQVTPDGREPFGYDYHQVSHVAPWKIVPGRYTREGDVKELLMRTDDVFVISRPGDEIALSFDATGLPPLARGWNRTFLFYVDGFSKEMDINSATPDSLGPLPFHAMERYPYSAPERFPMTAARRRMMERYNTRVVRSTLPPVEAGLAGKVFSTEITNR
jgi:tetratricopeptide (TPR) repeat protein